MEYLTYEEYKNWGGDISEQEFSHLQTKAKIIINKYTGGKLKGLKEVPDEVKACVFDLIKINKRVSSNVASERAGNWSVTYGSYSKEEIGLQIDEILRLYLDDLLIDGEKVVNKFGGAVLYV